MSSSGFARGPGRHAHHGGPVENKRATRPTRRRLRDLQLLAEAIRRQASVARALGLDVDAARRPFPGAGMHVAGEPAPEETRKQGALLSRLAGIRASMFTSAYRWLNDVELKTVCAVLGLAEPPSVPAEHVPEVLRHLPMKPPTRVRTNDDDK